LFACIGLYDTINVMTTEPLTEIARPSSAPAPTAEQIARRTARKRFNRLYVYLPLALVAFLLLLLIVGMLWLTIGGRWFHIDTNQEYYRSLVSGVADAFLVLMLLPLILVCTLPPIGAIGFVVWRRRRRKVEPDGYGKLPLFWRLDNVVTRVQSVTAATTPKLADPVVTVHGAASYIRTLLQEIRKIFSREIDRYVD
jgi:hypothetical protein